MEPRADLYFHRRIPLLKTATMLLSSILCLALQVHAQVDIKIAASPAALQPANGKLPSSVLLAVSVTPQLCETTDLSRYALMIAAPGLTLSQASPGKCVIMATLNVDPNTPAGKYKIVLLDNTNKPIGSTDFAVLETTAGAIPGGIAPQVDVIWEVLTQKVCNDVFGKRVARNFYCVEIKLGNNTGHPLQLAGVGFSQHLENLPGKPDVILANTSYASTRAVLLRESVLSPRNIFYHSMQATGLIMAGFIPFFHAANATAHYATAVSIVSGPLLQAINLVGPDRVVSQLNNLDDQSFRDNMIIPNNSQVRTIVFVEKLALTELLDGLSNSVSAEIDKQMRAAAATDNSSASDRASATQNASQAKARVQTSAAQTRKNSQQTDTGRIFKFSTGDLSPLLVKLALGNLVVIGDEIEYLQRVQVQGASASNVAALTVSPSRLDFGNQDVALASAVKTVTVTNTSTAALSGLTINITGTNQGDYTQANDCGASIAAGASCTVSVTFTPAAQQARGAILNVAYAGGSPQTVSLSGAGNQVTPGVSFSPLVPTAFAGQKVGSPSSPQVLTFTNTGATAIAGITVSLGGANASDFAQVNTCGAALAAAANCTISVTFTPLATGARVATLTVVYTSAGAQQPVNFSLNGTGTSR